MNTLIHLWVEPMVMEHKRCPNDCKVYFNAVIKGKHNFNNDEAMEVLDGKLMASIMDFGDIDTNWDYGVVSTKLTTKPVGISYGLNLEEQAEEQKEKIHKKIVKQEKRKIAKINAEIAVLRNKKIRNIVSGKQELAVTKKDFTINDDGTISVSINDLATTETIDFPKIWTDLEKNFIGKIAEGQRVELVSDSGEKIFEMVGGSFLNVAIADMHVYDTKTMPDKDKIGLYNRGQGLKGGLFIREDGRLDIGDFNRTFFLTINTKNLIRAALKAKKSLMEVTKMKLLKP